MFVLSEVQVCLKRLQNCKCNINILWIWKECEKEFYREEWCVRKIEVGSSIFSRAVPDVCQWWRPVDPQCIRGVLRCVAPYHVAPSSPVHTIQSDNQMNTLCCPKYCIAGTFCGRKISRIAKNLNFHSWRCTPNITLCSTQWIFENLQCVCL